MKFYIAVNSDGTEIISKRPIKRFDASINKDDVCSYDDTEKPPHWVIDYTDSPIVGRFDVPIDVYLTLPSGSLQKMFGITLTWGDSFKEIDL